MTGESYYYIFSITAVLVIFLHIANMMYYRALKRTLFGHEFKVNSLEEQNMRKFTGRKGLLIASAIAIVLVVNLIYAVQLVASQDTPSSRMDLFSLPIFCLILFAIIFIIIRKQLGVTKSNGHGR